MKTIRLFKHLAVPGWWARRRFPAPLLKAIEAAVAASERVHLGELRLVIEAGLPLHDLLRDTSTRARAHELFSQLRVWDTAHNSGVLIYVQLIDRRVEIIADRGIAECVDGDFWCGVCRRMEEAFAAGGFERGTLAALEEITDTLATHYPATAKNPDELPDAPLLR